MQNNFNAKKFVKLVDEVKSLEDKLNNPDFKAEAKSLYRQYVSNYKENVDELLEYLNCNKPVVKVKAITCECTNSISGYMLEISSPDFEKTDNKAERMMEFFNATGLSFIQNRTNSKSYITKLENNYKIASAIKAKNYEIPIRHETDINYCLEPRGKKLLVETLRQIARINPEDLSEIEFRCALEALSDLSNALGFKIDYSYEKKKKLVLQNKKESYSTSLG